MQREKFNYFIIDKACSGSKMDSIYDLYLGIISLYLGRSESVLADFAPYIIDFSYAEDVFLPWLYKNGFNDNWGIFLNSEANLKTIWRHFRKFLIVQDEEGKELYFRFYDPRVLRIFLPSCDSEQLKEFFGPIDYFLVESEDPDVMIKFYLENNELKSENIDADLFFKNHSDNDIHENKTEVLTSNDNDLNIV